MISNHNSTIIVNGASPITPVYKRSETELVRGMFYIGNNTDEPLGAIGITVNDIIKGYHIKVISLHELSTYNISGVAYPGNRLIYISRGFKKDDISYFKNNVIATAYANKSGNFEFSNISCEDGLISLWMVNSAHNSTIASLTYSLSVSFDADSGGFLSTYSFIEKAEYANPKYTISGTCTSDIKKVYMSITTDTTSVANLINTMFTSVDVNANGTFSINKTVESPTKGATYIIWALSENSDGGITVKSITSKNDISVCLSGDTLITMSDMSKRRLDSLVVGDLILSEEGTSSPIININNGIFSDYHTLYYFEDGTIINETHPHRFYNTDQGFWQRLELWNIGDHAINQDGLKVALISKERIHEEIEMFGIWTDSGSYYANGLLSGAASCNKKLLADATAEQAIDMMLSTDEEWLVHLMGLEATLP